MTIEEIQGDLFAAEVDAIAHGCNTRGLMGAGIAKLIRDKFPVAYAAYKHQCQAGRFVAGSVQICMLSPEEQGDHRFSKVINLGTQVEPGADAKIEHIRACFLALADTYHAPTTVGIPAIGCGIGGLNWPEVKAAIEEVIAGSDITVKAYFI